MISIVVPTRRSSKDLVDCLESLSSQQEKCEIITVFDDEKDSNINAAKKYGRVAFDKGHTIGSAYMTGTRFAKGDIIAFMDDDCIAPRNWTAKIQKEFDGGIDILGGEDLLPEKSTFFQRAAFEIDKSRILKKPIYGEKAKNRLRAANIAYRKNVFQSETFNPNLKGLQEPEFHYRLFKNHFIGKENRIKFNPDVFVYHKRRNSLKGIFNQIYRNGIAKIQLLRMHSDMISDYDILFFLGYISLLAAIALDMAGFALPAISKFTFLWMAMTAAYFLTKPLLYIAKTGGLKYYFHLVAIIAAREIAYGLGLIVGLARLGRN